MPLHCGGCGGRQRTTVRHSREDQNRLTQKFGQSPSLLSPSPDPKPRYPPTRNCNASATSAETMVSRAARSATVRATRSTRVTPRALN